MGVGNAWTLGHIVARRCHGALSYLTLSTMQGSSNWHVGMLVAFLMSLL